MKTIYIIRNKVNGKCYVGSSKNYKQRVHRHIRNLKHAGYKSFSKLYPAMLKFGIMNFEFVPVENCTNSIAPKREAYWINKKNSHKKGYNCNSYGGGGISYWKGKHRSHSDRIKISKTLTGRKLPDSVRRKISQALKGRWPWWASRGKTKAAIRRKHGDHPRYKKSNRKAGRN